MIKQNSFTNPQPDDMSGILSNNKTTNQTIMTKEENEELLINDVQNTAPPRILAAETEVGIDILDQIIGWTERVSFGKFAADELKDKDYYVASIDALQKTALDHGLGFGFKNSTYYVYNAQYWQKIDTGTFRHFLEVIGLKQEIPLTTGKNHSFVAHLVKQFESAMRFPVASEDDLPKLNLLNGTLHFTAGGVELKAFDKEDGLTYQLGYEYNLSAEAPLFKTFLDRVLPDSGLQRLVFQYLGYVFLPYLKLEKIALFYGSGANGKSVLLDIFTGLVGKEQVCEYSLEGITKTEYERAQIAGYLLNISTETSRTMKLSMFKKLASREALPCRRLRHDPFIAKRYATSIFATNELPQSTEQTAAFFRRLLIIPFNIQIPETEQDPELAKTIIASELSGVLNYLVEGVRSLVEKGKFEIPDSVHAVVDEFRRESDNVLAFLEENRFRPDAEQYTALREWFDAYRKQCSRDGSKAVAKVTFSRRLRSLGYRVERIGRDHRTVDFACRED